MNRTIAAAVSVLRQASPLLNDDQKRRLMQLIEETGGYTTRGDLDEHPAPGTMVSLPASQGHEEILPTSTVNGENQDDYLKRKQDMMQNNPDLWGGGWDDSGTFYNDLSQNYDDPWEAAHAAIIGEQLGVYNTDMYDDAVSTQKFFNDQIAKGGRRNDR